MWLVDSNVLIDAALTENEFLLHWLLPPDAHLAAISIPEVFGFSSLNDDDKKLFEEYFELLPVLPADGQVLYRAAELRRARRMKLGDSVIAATALLSGLDLVTRNVDDFGGISDLVLINPFAE